MNTLRIETRNGLTAFAPGDELAGTVSWELDRALQAVELRLFWYTRGKGTTDVGVVETVRFDNPGQRDRRDFRFTLPASPYSFSGRLVSLVWALELVAGKESTRLDLTVAPGGREVLLQR